VTSASLSAIMVPTSSSLPAETLAYRTSFHRLCYRRNFLYKLVDSFQSPAALTGFAPAATFFKPSRIIA